MRRPTSSARGGIEPGWITKREAADRLAVSPKSVERLAKNGRIDHRHLRRADGKVIAVYGEEQVQTIAERRRAELSLVSRAGTSTEPSSRRSKPPTAMEILRQIVETLRLPRPSERLLLTVDDAVCFSGLSHGEIEAAIRGGELKVLQCQARQLIRRSDVAAFVERML